MQSSGLTPPLWFRRRLVGSGPGPFRPAGDRSQNDSAKSERSPSTRGAAAAAAEAAEQAQTDAVGALWLHVLPGDHRGHGARGPRLGREPARRTGPLGRRQGHLHRAAYRSPRHRREARCGRGHRQSVHLQHRARDRTEALEGPRGRVPLQAARQPARRHRHAGERQADPAGDHRARRPDQRADRPAPARRSGFSSAKSAKSPRTAR